MKCIKLFALILSLGFLFFSPICNAQDVNLTIHSFPDQADVVINGVKRGNTPILIKVRQNSYFKLDLKKADFQTYTIDYEAKENNTLYVDLSSGQEVDKMAFRKLKQSNKSSDDDDPVNAVNKGDEKNDQEMDTSSPKIDSVVPPPQISPQLKSLQISGTAFFRVNVSPDSQPLSIFPLESSASQELDDYITDWMKEWKYKAAIDRNFPVAGFIDIEISYDFPTGTFEVMNEKYFSSGAPIAEETEEFDEAEESESKVPLSSIDLTKDEKPMKAEDAEFKPVPSDKDSDEGKDIDQTIPEDIPDCTDKKISTPPEILQPPKFTSIPIDIQNLNLKGDAVFRVLVDQNGKVKEIETIKSTGEVKLDEWIKPVLKNCEWLPAQSNNKSIMCWRTMKLEFYTLACRFEFVDLYK